MSNHPAKRARLSTDADAVDPSKIPELVNSIDDLAIIAKLLIIAAETHPDVASLVQGVVDCIAAAERTQVLNFDYLSKSVWETLNVTYERLKCSHAFEMTGEAAQSIEGCIDKIRRCCSKPASFKTKESALETLRKIGKSICLSNGVVGHGIRKFYGSGGKLVPVMLDIAESLTDEEMDWLRPWCDDKLVELQGIADGYCIFEDLSQVLELWGEDEETENENEDEGSSNGNEEDEGENGDA